MAASDTQTQLEELKRQVAALSEARLAQAEAAPPDVTEPPAESSEAEPSELSTRLEELVELLGTELRDNPMVTGVAIFVAGLLVGRMMR